MKNDEIAVQLAAKTIEALGKSGAADDVKTLANDGKKISKLFMEIEQSLNLQRGSTPKKPKQAQNWKPRE